MNARQSVIALSLFGLLQLPATVLAGQDPHPSSAPPTVLSNASGRVDYRLLATSKTGTMQKELNEAAAEGYRFVGVMGGGTAVGSEVVVIMAKGNDSAASAGFEYRLLATSKTSTMQKELQEAANLGYEYRGQSVFNSAFGGDEVVVILERERDAHIVRYEYLLLATNRTGTMQKELKAAGDQGYEYVGVTVSKTAFGGNEVVTILRRPVAE